MKKKMRLNHGKPWMLVAGFDTMKWKTKLEQRTKKRERENSETSIKMISTSNTNKNKARLYTSPNRSSHS